MGENRELVYLSQGCLYPTLTSYVNSSTSGLERQSDKCAVTVAEIAPNAYRITRIVMLSMAVPLLALSIWMLYNRVVINYNSCRKSLRAALLKLDVLIWFNAVLFVFCHVLFAVDPFAAGDIFGFYAVTFFRYFFGCVVFNILVGYIYAFQLTLAELLSYSVNYLKKFVLGSIFFQFISVVIVLVFECLQIRDFIPRVIWTCTFTLYFAVTMGTGIVFIHQVMQLDGEVAPVTNLGRRPNIILKLVMVSLVLPCLGLSYFILSQLNRLKTGKGTLDSDWFAGFQTQEELSEDFVLKAGFNHVFMTAAEIAFSLATLPICMGKSRSKSQSAKRKSTTLTRTGKISAPAAKSKPIDLSATV